MVIPFLDVYLTLPVFIECLAILTQTGSLCYIKRNLLTEMVLLNIFFQLTPRHCQFALGLDRQIAVVRHIFTGNLEIVEPSGIACETEADTANIKVFLQENEAVKKTSEIQNQLFINREHKTFIDDTQL